MRHPVVNQIQLVTVISDSLTHFFLLHTKLVRVLNSDQLCGLRPCLYWYIKNWKLKPTHDQNKINLITIVAFDI